MAPPPHSDGEPPADADNSVSDADLITATRGGDTTAYGELYARHVGAANRLARILARDGAEADDLVSETFAKVLTTMRNGRGPDLAFRAYLLTTLRHTFYDRTKRDKKIEFTDDMTRHDRGESFEDPAVAGMERSYAARAFKRLPERWQVVLWHTEIEKETPKQVAVLLGLSPNGVSALAYRARERLRQAFLQEHAKDTADADCQWTADRLGARVRAGLSPRDSEKVDHHLEDCAPCKLLFAELGELNQSIPKLIAPLVLGAAAIPYLGAGVKAVAAGAGLGGLFTGAWTWILRGGDKVRQVAQHVGGKGAAVGGGVAAVAVVVALILVANEGPPPPPVADPPANNAPAPPPDDPADPADPPEDPPGVPPDDPTRPPSNPPPTAPSPTPRPSDPAKDFAIYTPEIGNDLVAGNSGTLPITVRSPERASVGVAPEGGGQGGGVGTFTERAAPDDVVLVASVPRGVTLKERSAGDGWSCVDGREEGSTHRITCTRPKLKAGASSTARLKLDIPKQVSGFQSVKVTVDTADRQGEARLRIAIAPKGMNTAYASVKATGIAVVGDTLLTCKKQPHCLKGPMLDNHTRRMTPYVGSDPDVAVSSAELSLPSGADVTWAGLYWTSSGTSVPRNVHLSGPGGSRELSPDRVYSGYERAVTQAVAEVTDLIRAGNWKVSVDAGLLPDGVTEYAGWSLVVAYDSGADNEVGVYEGLAQPRHGTTLDLQVEHSGPVTVGFVLWDGDRSLGGDCAALGSATVGENGNLGHSQAAGSGEDHTFGVDAAVHKVDTSPSNDTLRITTGWDPLDIGVIATAA
ncbi:sigma-70 family RNA polymerase sigma factor [Phytomonospora sp. NPDC050363]|uniref:sigma-70 family RNA polymerase sigma factor n=1 Tax=Phytomonospora sp. NPDC050363 TaxID=3155642 RepID=UPI0033ED33D9